MVLGMISTARIREAIGFGRSHHSTAATVSSHRAQTYHEIVESQLSAEELA